MAKTVLCDIVSAEEAIFSGQVEMLIAPGIQGELGITPGHAPLLTRLNPGAVRILYQDSDEVLFISGGFLEVQPASIKILADSAQRAEDMDESAALRAKQDAERALKNQNDSFNYSKAMAELMEASARLRAAQIAGKQRKKIQKIDTRY